MISIYRTELKGLVRKHGAKKIFKLFPTEADYVETSNAMVKELCKGDINQFHETMDLFVKDALVRLGLVDFIDE